jgi:hypothetical protein
VDLANVRKVMTGGASIVAVVLLMSATVPGQLPKMVVLHATVSISGGVSFTGSFDQPLVAPSCADLAKTGTRPASTTNAIAAAFYLPIPPPKPDGSYGSVGGGHTFAADVSAYPYHGPGTYTGSALNATQMDADTPPESQETHIFAFPTGIGTLIVKPDASGSFEFHGLQDPGSVTISGTVIWTCS